MSEFIDQIVEISKLAKFLREDATVLVNTHELTSLTLIVQEGWQLGSKVAQMRKEPELNEINAGALAKVLRYQATLVEETLKNHAQNLALINHITRFSQNLHRMVREIPFIEDAEYHDGLVIKRKTGFLIDEATYHQAMREIATLFSKLGEIKSKETPTCPLSELLVNLARILGMIEQSLQSNVVYRGSPQILAGLIQLAERFQYAFRPIYWMVKNRYFRDDIQNGLQLLETIVLGSDTREEQPVKAKKSKKPKEWNEILKSLEGAFDKESQKKQIPSMDSPLAEIK